MNSTICYYKLDVKKEHFIGTRSLVMVYRDSRILIYSNLKLKIKKNFINTLKNKMFNNGCRKSPVLT